MCKQRNRSSGWKYAKRSGHANEINIETLLRTDTNFCNRFLDRLGKSNVTIIEVSGGGIKEHNVDSVFPNETTKSKTDIYVRLSDESKYNLSLKKSLGGQVYIIKPDRFIKGYEKQYKINISEDVKRAINLFWGASTDIQDIIEQFATNSLYERRKHRLVGDTLKVYNETLYNKLLIWFRDNIYNITDFCFSKGLAKNKEDWADIVWYKNELGENSVDKMFLISEIRSKVIEKLDLIEYGNIHGGTTIQLPFGFVQWHSPQKTFPGCLQFHHSYDKIQNIADSF